MVLLIEQQRANLSGQRATKTLKRVVDKVGRFDKKNITKVLRTYTYKMELHQMAKTQTMELFKVVVVLEIREQIRDLRIGVHVNIWIMFGKQSRDKVFDENMEMMTKRSFLE